MKTFLLLLLALASTSAAVAQDTFNILVAPRGTTAFSNAEAQADGSTVFAESALWRGLNRAASLLNEGGDREVRVLIASGDYGGELGSGGTQRVPQVENPRGSLKVFGGMNDDFSDRDPFSRFVSVPTQEDRGGALFQIAGNSEFREIVISGLVLDAAPSNDYDSRSGSLLKGSSRTFPILAWAQVEAERVVVADNIIVNGPMGGFQIGSSPPEDNTGEVIVENNYFVNNLLALRTRTFGANAFRAYALLTVRNNTFALNFPFNADPTSSNVSAVEWHNDNSFKRLVFENNIFAHNPGGAFQSDWEQEDLPEIEIRDNLFYSNGAVFGQSGPEDVVVAGKFGTNPEYILLDLDGARDNLRATVSGNVSFDPDLRLALVADQRVDPSFIKAQVDEIDDPRELFGFSTGTVAVGVFAPEMLLDTRVVPIARNPDAQAYGVQRDDVRGQDE
ncbi:hypothetical protein [Rubrivirga sp.]|uniref:hypothetical protein n=1 Tax=Rubrivirga sp. TaxID=1885344 RepID=UPI003C796CAF